MRWIYKLFSEESISSHYEILKKCLVKTLKTSDTMNKTSVGLLLLVIKRAVWFSIDDMTGRHEPMMNGEYQSILNAFI